MFVKYVVFCSFVVLCMADKDGSVCSQNIKQQVTYVELETESYFVTTYAICTKSALDDYYYHDDYSNYDSRVITYSCYKNEMKIRRVPKTKQKLETRINKFCCPGYSRVNVYSSTAAPDEITCAPDCAPPCRNGHCVAPDECSCSIGYKQSENVIHGCEPHCPSGCGAHATCTEPNLCTCDEGYELTSTDKNHFDCTKIDCSNGTCVPQCKNGCENGRCVADDLCVCEIGFRLVENDSTRKWTCIPECEPGYIEVNGECEPECDPSCGHGTCTAPNECECDLGYKIDIYKSISDIIRANSTVCVPSCKYCIGECVAPNVCISTTSTSTSTPRDVTITPIDISTTTTSTTSTVETTTSRTTIVPVNAANTIPIFRFTTAITSTVETTTPKPRQTTSTLETTTPKPTIVPTYTRSSLPERQTTSTSVTYTTINRFRGRLSTIPPTTTTHKYENDNRTYKEVDYNSTSKISDHIGDLTWWEQHWVSVVIPLAIVVLAAMVLLVVWLRAPIIIFLRGRSYFVEDQGPRNDSGMPFHYSKKKEVVESEPCSHI